MLFPTLVMAAGADLPIRAKIINLTTIEGIKKHCEDGYAIACEVIEPESGEDDQGEDEQSISVTNENIVNYE